MLFYEDVAEGLEFLTPEIGLTEEQIDRFADLSGDRFQVHLDDAFARSLGFERRIGHGLLGLILLDGLKNQSEQQFAAVASLGWQWNFRAPLYPGERLHGRIRVVSKRLTSKGDRGIVTLALALRDGKGETLQEGTNLLLIRRR